MLGWVEGTLVENPGSRRCQEEVTEGGARRRCLLHLLVELVQPLGLSTDSGTEADRGEGAHLEVTSVLWQTLDPASLRTAFELSVG